MRFSSVIDDLWSFTDISQATISASKNEKITLKMFPDSIYFVCRNPHRRAGYFIEIRVSERNNKSMLNAEVKNDDVYSRCIPVTICKTNEIFEFLTPTVNPSIIGLIVKQINTFKDIIETFHELSVETVNMELFPDCELHMKAVTETRGEYCIIFDELHFIQEVEGAEESDVFRLRVADIYNFFGCLPSDAKRFSIRKKSVFAA